MNGRLEGGKSGRGEFPKRIRNRDREGAIGALLRIFYRDSLSYSLWIFRVKCGNETCDYEHAFAIRVHVDCNGTQYGSGDSDGSGSGDPSYSPLNVSLRKFQVNFISTLNSEEPSLFIQLSLKAVLRDIVNVCDAAICEALHLQSGALARG